jgi:hypothetical protein
MGHEGHAPIRKLIEDEQIRARTRKVDMEMAEAASAKEARDKARNDAVEQHAKEGRLASGGLNNAILGTGIAAGVLGAAFKAVPWVVKQLEACAKETDAVEPCKACSRPMPPGHVLGLLERAVRLASNALEHNRDAVELMRLHFGEPQKLIGISAVQDLGPEEMEVALQRMLESVRASKAAAAALKPSIMPKAEVN